MRVAMCCYIYTSHIYIYKYNIHVYIYIYIYVYTVHNIHHIYIISMFQPAKAQHIHCPVFQPSGVGVPGTLSTPGTPLYVLRCHPSMGPRLRNPGGPWLWNCYVGLYLGLRYVYTYYIYIYRVIYVYDIYIYTYSNPQQDTRVIIVLE